MKRLEERKIHVRTHRRGEGAARPGGVRSDVRRPAAQAHDSAPGARSAGAARSRGRVRARVTPSIVDAGGGRADGSRNARPSEHKIEPMPASKAKPRFNPARRRSPRPPAARAAARHPRCGTASPSCCCSSSRRCTTWRRPGEHDPLQRVQDAGQERRGRRGHDQRAGRSAARSSSRRRAIRNNRSSSRRRASRIPKLDRGARGPRRQVHRRGRQSLAARSAGLDHSAALLRRNLGILLPPDGRRRRRRDVVRAQPREDLRRR